MRAPPLSGGNGSQQRVHEGAAGSFPVGVEVAPGVAVAGGEALQRGRRLVDVGRDHRAGPVGLWVRDR